MSNVRNILMTTVSFACFALSNSNLSTAQQVNEEKPCSPEKHSTTKLGAKIDVSGGVFEATGAGNKNKLNKSIDQDNGVGIIIETYN